MSVLSPGVLRTSWRKRCPGSVGVQGGGNVGAADRGRTYRDQGRIAPVEQLLAARGANLVRLRLWVNPPPGTSDLGTALVLGRRANAAGCHLLLDLHYSDFWADPGTQTTPAAWTGQDLAQLSRTVHDYTRDVVTAFVAQDTPPLMIQIGNEISRGMLWPVGAIHRDGGERWDAFAELVKAGVAGAREGAPSGITTIVHLETGGDNDACRHFYDNIGRRGVEFDVIGLSYFPWWHGSLSMLRSNMTDLAARYDKGVLIVETGYPWILPEANGVSYYVRRATQLPDRDRFPATPEGQAAFFEQLRAIRSEVPDRRGLGFVAWEPAWMPEVRASEGEENRYANITMFDWHGAGLPSLAAFRA
ncbi:arabinogalactan endo-beta-1,4-galactanase [Pseudonocardia hispaniensis]|uniref:Arabinogalactan endo-beta-1,4-galactanase n=1 Tax=Pseudonocardia hispaniensis TaxID=904933 RepID=A0ABW1IWI5_9PSEU